MAAEKRPRFYTAAEVAEHNCLEDLWVSFLGGVYNLTPLAAKYEGEMRASSAAGVGDVRWCPVLILPSTLPPSAKQPQAMRCSIRC